MGIKTDWHIFTDEEIAKAPISNGVYGLYEISGKPATIYFGKGEGLYGIKGRLQSHKAGNEGTCTKSADYFNYETCYDPSARERELIEEHKKIWGKLPRCNEVMP
jgi:hypothetical protein